MRTRKLYTKERGKYKEGRKADIKHILIPKEVKEDLDLFKDAYSICLSMDKDEYGNPIPVKVTYEQMFRRWMDQVGRFDKDVKKYFDEAKKAHAKNPLAPTYPVDPTEGDVENMRYFFEKDGEEIEAYTGYWPGFYAVVDGEKRDQEAMMADGWILMNDAGIEISQTQAIEISIRMKSSLDRFIGAIKDDTFFPEGDEE